jgi:hypothetical protein
MPEWVNAWVPVLQLLINAGALVGGTIIWKLYVDNLKAANAVKDATIENSEKSRDYWREKAGELEKKSPEAMEIILAERIDIRDGEINRLKEDKQFDKSILRSLEMAKAELEQDLARTQGFRSMLALENEYDFEDEPETEEDSGHPEEQMPKAVGRVHWRSRS